MSRAINRLSALKVKNAPTGMHADGGGLYLKVRNADSKAWVFVYQWEKKRKEIGLGGLADVNLAQAREAAASARDKVIRGIDPGAPPEAAPAPPEAVPTFGKIAIDMLDSVEGGWKNVVHRKQWRSTLETYAAPIWNDPVDEISTADVLKCLQPIWTSKTETATRVRGRIERVLNTAKALGHRPENSVNPAAWAGHLALMLPKPKKLAVRGHHAAKPYADVGPYLTRLRQRPGVGARALELLIYTVPRTTECIGAQAREFDMVAKVWTIPAERMKAGIEHRIPLSTPAVALVERLLEGLGPDDYLFRTVKGQCGTLTADEVIEAYRGGEKVRSIAKRAGVSPVSVYGAMNRAERPDNRPVSAGAMDKILRLDAEEDRTAKAATVHGFRSSFRDWVGEETDFPDRLAEQAIAHLLEDKAERAYRRGSALERRRVMMQAWADYLAASVVRVAEAA